MKTIVGFGWLLLLAGLAHADYTTEYEVTITNVTKGQFFTPQLLATHDRSVATFALGEPASLAMEVLAEGGDTNPLTEELLSMSYRVRDVQTIGGLLGPGQSVTMTIEGSNHHRFLSLAAMLIPTNDTFVALDGVALPRRGSRTYLALAYDAGTEVNDQNCLNIPGPRCGGEGHSPGPNDGDEGYVYIGNGFHELPAVDFGEVLDPLVYDWRNPVAKVVVKKFQ